MVALGDGQSGLHLWEDVNALTVADAPVKSLMRQVGAVKNLALGTVKELALPMSHGLVDEAPAMMTVRVESSDRDHELATYVAAAVGYPQTEVDLSRTLLTRLTEGATTMATTLAAMSEWGRAWEGGSPRGADRERLLQGWVSWRLRSRLEPDDDCGNGDGSRDQGSGQLLPSLLRRLARARPVRYLSRPRVAAARNPPTAARAVDPRVESAAVLPTTWRLSSARAVKERTATSALASREPVIAVPPVLLAGIEALSGLTGGPRGVRRLFHRASARFIIRG
ncbi:hypothetical protein ACFY20_41705 [Streptomyces sp. NPDC001312]|uniref:hypothetical protein n=1 Tax=Streptomyces sp. NPDC001312 TaxID=3364561 RepID=UPI003678463E